MNRTAALFLVLLYAFGAEAQLVEYPLPSATRTKTKRLAARTQALDPTFLPFFDDFSANDTLLRDSLWLYGQSVLLNNGLGIRPPSKNVVSFDGADSLGKPYNLNDVLAKGFADRLISQPIRMDLVSPADRATVFFSFFYQLQGRGEPPDPGDQLILSFKAQDGTWENVLMLETSSAMPTDSFQQVIIPVSDDKFFHNAFQFRFSNYARLSGPFDTWNVDYVYLNRLRDANDIYYPDRTISSPFTSLFVGYYSMPITHFLKDRAGNLDYPSVELYNLKAVDSLTGGGPHKQPLKYNTLATIDSRIDSTITSVLITLDTLKDPGVLPGLQFNTLVLETLPDTSYFSLAADSIHIRIELQVNTKDNVPSSLLGDYNPQKYRPIDFRYSDTLAVDYVLSSYYAYDDGAAEYAAGLNQAGTYFAYQFNSRINSVDTLTYVDIYFPEFGDNTNQSLLLQIRSILGDIAAPPLFEQLIVVQRSTMNKFARYPLYRPVPVGSTFYVGWKQITNASIPVGLDKNTNNASKMYFNTTGDWVQNVDVQGSLMVRPGFGKGDGSVVTGLETPARAPVFFPNPSRGTCTLRARANAVDVYDLTGRRAGFRWETSGEETTLNFDEGSTGLFLVRVLVNGRAYTQKIMVLPAGR